MVYLHIQIIYIPHVLYTYEHGRIPLTTDVVDGNCGLGANQASDPDSTSQKTEADDKCCLVKSSSFLLTQYNEPLYLTRAYTRLDHYLFVCVIDKHKQCVRQASRSYLIYI